MAIAALTVIASLLVTATGFEMVAADVGGFVPVRVGLALAGPDQGTIPVWLTPFTSALVHAGILHLMFNLVMLVYAGVATERALGSRGIVVLYLVGAVAACAAQWLPDPTSAQPMIGASGAVSALVGAYSLLYGRQKTRDLGPIPAWVLHVLWLLAAWTALNLAVGLISASTGTPIAAAAHIGGFIAGLALCRPLLLWRWRRA